jgi:hypothetical protein
MKYAIEKINNIPVSLQTFDDDQDLPNHLTLINFEEVDFFVQEIIKYQNIKAEKPNRINFLKEELQKTDYKIIKNYELIAAGLQPEYDPVVLHNQRQAWRNEISELEK